MPGLILAGAGAGLTQAPLFAAASSLPANRATTGSGVLNMARQTGSALGVAMLVALLATAHPNELASYHHGWWFLIAATLAAAGDELLVAVRIHLNHVHEDRFAGFRHVALPCLTIGSRASSAASGPASRVIA